MTIKTRFAPSPTGHLHVGNARIALFNWLLARRFDGECLLRLDDTDAIRSRAEFADQIKADLAWLGLDFDETIHQSNRTDRYMEVFERLRRQDALYPCYESQEELDRLRTRLRAQKRAPSFRRIHARDKNDGDGDPYWRFCLSNGAMEWEEPIFGKRRVHLSHLSDPIIRRGDGTFLYLLPSVIDDIDFAVNRVLRGEDHMTNTAVQIDMLERIATTTHTTTHTTAQATTRATAHTAAPADHAAANPPKPHHSDIRFIHLPLLCDSGGKGLSKRHSLALTLARLRREGIEPIGIHQVLFRLGQSMPTDARDLADMIRIFDVTTYSRAPARLADDAFVKASGQILQSLPLAAIRTRLEKKNPALAGALTKAMWAIIGPNITTVDEVAFWIAVCVDTLAPPGSIDGGPTDSDILDAALACLPQNPWPDDVWNIWIKALKKNVTARGKALFQPIRIALTGRPSGPELGRLLPLIGSERTKKRLQNHLEKTRIDPSIL